MGARFEVELASSRQLSPSVKSLVFRRCDGEPMQFAPGQFVNLLTSAGDKRSYSIASAPDGQSSFELAVTRVEGGVFSNELHQLELGGRLTAIGPEGLFTRKAEDERPSLFVGTGTGVAPLRSMIASALASGSQAPMRLLFGVRTEADVFYESDYRSWAQQANVKVQVTLSRGSNDWSGKRGYVQHHLEEVLSELGQPEVVQVYICGLSKMVAEVKELARGKLALPRRHVHVERFD